MLETKRVVRFAGGEVLVRRLSLVDLMVMRSADSPQDELFTRALPREFDLAALSMPDQASVVVAVMELNEDLLPKHEAAEVAERLAAFRGGEPAGEGPGSPGGGSGGDRPDAPREPAAPTFGDGLGDGVGASG